MNASLIAIYMKPGISLKLGFLEELARAGGFQLQNRQNGRITLIDDEGESCAVEERVLAARIDQREDTRLQFWEQKWDSRYPGDLYCRVAFKATTVVVEFGELPHDSDLLLKGIWGNSRRLLDDRDALGLVIDRRGITEEYADWDAFFVEGKSYDGPCPDLLCFDADRARILPASCQEHHRRVHGYYIVLLSEQMAQLLEEQL